MGTHLFREKTIFVIIFTAFFIACALFLYSAPQTSAAAALDIEPKFPTLPDALLYYPIHAGECIQDVDGANDKSGQSDMTRLCFDNFSVPGVFLVQWNWDETGTNGGNTMDSTTFFDSNGDGLVNYAMNITTNGNPATLTTANLYTCDNSAPARCGGAVLVTGFDFRTVCAVYQESATQVGDPFPTGSGYPWDAVGYCEIPTTTFSTAVNVLNVCSKTSASITSAEADCVADIGGGFVTIIKNEYPTQGHDWTFEIRKSSDNLLIKSAILTPLTKPLEPLQSTARVRYSLAPAAYNVAEANAGAYGYTLISAICTDQAVVLGSGSNPINNITLQSGHEIFCEFTNAAPTAIDLAEFSAAPQTNAIELTWTTANEINFTGYNIYRSTDKADNGEKINADLIPAQFFGQILGATYSFRDETALFGQTYYYRLEMMLVGGNTEFSDHVYATPLGLKVFLPITIK